MILFSFAVTQVVYVELLMIDYFSTLHNLVVFIVLGISADNAFVIFDAWKQSNNILEFEGNFRKRIAYSFKRAFAAIIVTSSTTCVAFLSNGFSKIMPIKAFGIYAAIIIPVNLIIISIMFPPMLIFYDKYLAHRYCCIACGKSERKSRYVDVQIRDSCMAKFFGGPWNSFVRKLRWLILVVFFIWAGYACYIAKDVSPLTS